MPEFRVTKGPVTDAAGRRTLQTGDTFRVSKDRAEFVAKALAGWVQEVTPGEGNHPVKADLRAKLKEKGVRPRGNLSEKALKAKLKATENGHA